MLLLLTCVQFIGFFGHFRFSLWLVHVILALLHLLTCVFWPCFICCRVHFLCLHLACHIEIESAFISPLTNCISFLSSSLRFAFFLLRCLCFFFILLSPFLSFIFFFWCFPCQIWVLGFHVFLCPCYSFRS